MKVISIGDLVIDYYYKNGKVVGINGGMSSHNIIANISKMGLNTAVAGACGNDKQGLVAIKSLEDLKIVTKNIKVIEGVATRTFHVSYYDDKKYESKKRCPICNNKRWYEESLIDTEDIINYVQDDDVLVVDNLNDKNEYIIKKLKNRKMLDLGQYFEFENMNLDKIKDKITNRFDIINVNKRVEDYFKTKYNIDNLYILFKPKLLIVTYGKKGSKFISDDINVFKTLDNFSEEVDATGAGDAFFATFISEYIKNNFIVDNNFIDKTYEKAIKLTSKVVTKFGSRGHIQPLYKIKSVDDNCICQTFDVITRKQIKRCSININNLETRIINALKTVAYEKIKNINWNNINNAIFIGTGGSFAAAAFAAKVINNVYGINSVALYPRDVKYRNNSNVDSVFMFSYSGLTNDLYTATNLIDNDKKYIITKGEVQKIVIEKSIPKNNIISYRSSTNKGKEKGFLSFEGSLVPSCIFLQLYLKNNKELNIIDFIKKRINYWKGFFNDFVNNNNFFELGESYNVFTGDFTTSATIDLESKIIESGIFNCLVHEKKNFSHGRFVNYEHLSSKKNIYFKQKNSSVYEIKLLSYLSNGNNLIIESAFDGILCEFDLLIASQYLVYSISNKLNIDISKPSYSEDAMEIYFYKGEI